VPILAEAALKESRDSPIIFDDKNIHA
jgi:hypothetical protein